MKFRKPEWLDTSLGITGFMLSVLSTIALLSEDPFYTSKIAVVGALAFGLLIVIVSITFRPKHTLNKLPISKVKKLGLDLLSKSEEVIIVNPHNSKGLIEQLLPKAMSDNTPVSIIADATILNGIMDYIIGSEERKFFDSARISGSSSREFIICFIHKGRKKISLEFVLNDNVYIFTLTDESLVSIIANILKHEDQTDSSYIGLTSITAPRKILSVAHDEQQRYLRNFRTLQKGYISFYGTEVQSVQSGWVESGDFKRIDTLDITTRPDRLLRRARYNNANKIFIANGGIIRRVYMVRASDFSTKSFMKDLKELYKVQVSMGIEIGLVVLDDLPQNLRKDFILYDDAIVLIEDQQASSDYNLGRSTAFFGKEELIQHRSDFEGVWTGKVLGSSPKVLAVQKLAN